MSLFGKSNFDKLLENATSQMLMEPNWATNLELCDSIRQKDVTTKYAVEKIRGKICDVNPHVQKFALVVMETCVKNCGKPFHDEIAKHEFMDELRSLAQLGSAPVKEQVLTMVQAWNHAFRNTDYKTILATYSLMKMEGHKFPVLKESDAMFSSDAAPEWKDGDVCHHCRVKFRTFIRRHHCRACGEVFCSKCSSKNSIVPRLGMEREVRVCDRCHDEINPNEGQEDLSKSGRISEVTSDDQLPEEYLKSDLFKESQTKPIKSEEETKEEEELQLALALSLSENDTAGAKPANDWKPPQSSYQPSITTPVEKKSSLYADATANLKSMDDQQDELAQYMDRSYWEKKKTENSLQPSAPVDIPPVYAEVSPVSAPQEEPEEEVDESAPFVQTMTTSINAFVDRMNQVNASGKHIAMDPTVQSLFASLTAMHPQLSQLIEDQEASQTKYEAMLKKLSVIREARDSLNDMRAQHVEKTRQQELEQEMLRRMQMEQKLELMRQQKQEYLEYQRTLQLQRQQELEIYQQHKLQQRQHFEQQGYTPLPAAVVPPMSLSGGKIDTKDYNTPPPQYQDPNISMPPAYEDYAKNYQPAAAKEVVPPYHAEDDRYAHQPAAPGGRITSTAQPYYQEQGPMAYSTAGPDYQQQEPPSRPAVAQPTQNNSPQHSRQQIPPQQVLARKIPPQPQHQHVAPQSQHVVPPSQQIPPQSQQIVPPSQQIPTQSQPPEFAQHQHYHSPQHVAKPPQQYHQQPPTSVQQADQQPFQQSPQQHPTYFHPNQQQFPQRPTHHVAPQPQQQIPPAHQQPVPSQQHQQQQQQQQQPIPPHQQPVGQQNHLQQHQIPQQNHPTHPPQQQIPPQHPMAQQQPPQQQPSQQFQQPQQLPPQQNQQVPQHQQQPFDQHHHQQPQQSQHAPQQPQNQPHQQQHQQQHFEQQQQQMYQQQQYQQNVGQQNGYPEQQPTTFYQHMAPVEQQLAPAMKDLQLISFD